jgi:hypothetical protein
MSSTLRRASGPAAYALSRDRGPLDVRAVPAPRRRGRPPLAGPEQVLEQIREAAADNRLFRVHLDHPALYARARRLFGTWAGALHAAGVDYEGVIAEARRRAAATRRRGAAAARISDSSGAADSRPSERGD